MATGRYSQVQAPVTIVHSNLDQEIIQITEDRLRLVLKDDLELAEERKSWIAPLGIFLAIVTSCVTTEFREIFYVKAATWAAIFFLSGVLSFYWFCRAIYKAVNAPSLDDIVVKIKRGSASPKP